MGEPSETADPFLCELQFEDVSSDFALCNDRDISVYGENHFHLIT